MNKDEFLLLRCEKIEAYGKKIDDIVKKLDKQLKAPLQADIDTRHFDFIMEDGVQDVISYRQGVRDCMEGNVYQRDRVLKGDSSYDIGYNNEYALEQLKDVESRTEEPTYEDLG
jgi:hypothetical protein|tara:strand:- start:539 stop:880 length:342 start_codon:yes stop_codon:yes gene_type:complete